RIAGRMQRVAQKDQAGKFTRGRRSHLRGDSPAHRLAAYCHLVSSKLLVTAHCFDYRSVASFQFVIRIRRAAPELGVDKIESDGVDSARRKLVRIADHEIAALP